MARFEVEFVLVTEVEAPDDQPEVALQQTLQYLPPFVRQQWLQEANVQKLPPEWEEGEAIIPTPQGDTSVG